MHFLHLSYLVRIWWIIHGISLPHAISPSTANTCDGYVILELRGDMVEVDLQTQTQAASCPKQSQKQRVRGQK
jgi:hypothetical protein